MFFVTSGIRSNPYSSRIRILRRLSRPSCKLGNGQHRSKSSKSLQRLQSCTDVQLYTLKSRKPSLQNLNCPKPETCLNLSQGLLQPIFPTQTSFLCQIRGRRLRPDRFTASSATSAASRAEARHAAFRGLGGFWGVYRVYRGSRGFRGLRGFRGVQGFRVQSFGFTGKQALGL